LAAGARQEEAPMQGRGNPVLAARVVPELAGEVQRLVESTGASRSAVLREAVKIGVEAMTDEGPRHLEPSGRER
jgi:hypothetical protein